MHATLLKLNLVSALLSLGQKTFIQGSLKLLTVAAIALLHPVPASAHLITTGMGPVYDGIGHLLLTPEDLVPAIAIAIYAGLSGKPVSRLTLFLFPCAWFAGGLAGLFSDITLQVQPHFISFILLGTLIAFDRRVPGFLFIIPAGLIGILHGFYNGVAMQDGPGISGLSGISTLLFVLLAIISALTCSLTTNWARIVVRVAGSWIAAIGLLMFGWVIKTG